MDGTTRTCAYCGVPIASGETCAAHDDLPGVDPLGDEARRPVGERQAIAAWFPPGTKGRGLRKRRLGGKLPDE